jgi:hypothetical protein
LTCAEPLKGKQPEKHANDNIWLARNVGERAFAFDFDLKIGDRGRGDGIVGRKIPWTDKAADQDGLPVNADGNVTSSLNDQSAVGQGLHDLSGKIEADIGAEGGSAFPIETGSGVSIEKVLQVVAGTDGTEQAGDGGVGVELAALLVFAAGGGGKSIKEMNDDQIAGVAGFVVGSSSPNGLP